MVDAFAASLCARMSAVCPTASVDFDGQNVCLHRRGSTDAFVHIVVDFTCLEEDDTGTVAVHARPDGVFSSHWEERENGRTLVAADGEKFEGGDCDAGNEFEDGLGNTCWMFTFPRDGDKIASLAASLASFGAMHVV
jgi:hypothetical protein